MQNFTLLIEMHERIGDLSEIKFHNVDFVFFQILGPVDVVNE